MSTRFAPPIAVLALLLAGCFDNTYVKEDRTDRRPKVLAVTDHEGGAHDVVLVHERLWFVGQGPRLLVLEGRGATVKVVDAGPPGRTGAVVDLAIHRGDLVGVIGGDAVVRWDLANPRAPALIDRVDASTLGIKPLSLSLVGSELYVSGEGGVVRAGDGRLFLKGETAGAVVPTTLGLAAVCGRRVRLLETGGFVGAASTLQPVAGPDGGVLGFGFALGGKSGSTVGLMGPDLRERVGEVFTPAIHRVRVTGGRLWVLAEDQLASWAIRDGTLQDPVFAKVKGARDVAPLTDNLFAMVGSFGRAVYRLHDDREGAGDEFTDVRREPGRLDQSMFDGRRILAGGAEGYWLYPIRGKATLSEKTLDMTQVPENKATLAWGTVTIDAGDGKAETPDEGRALVVDGPGGKVRWDAPGGVRIACVVAIDGQLWVGHGRGITVLKGFTPPPPEDDDERTGRKAPASKVELTEVASVRIPGMVTWLHPLRTGGGAAWVSRLGGMGVAEFVPEGEEVPKRRSATTD
jgi:hypothetical protein